MQHENPFVLWLIETINRILSKSPKYMVWWQRISGALVLVGFLPYILLWIGVNVPTRLVGIEAKVLGWCASSALFMASVTKKDKVIGETVTGNLIVKPSDSKTLPFSAKEEQKQL